MPQADDPHTPPSPDADTAADAEPSADSSASVADIVFGMEDAFAAGLCLTDALIALSEGRRGTLRVRPGTIYYLAFEVQGRLEQLHGEWLRLFALTHPQPVA